MCAKRVSKELHDAFENDIEIDLSQDASVTSVEDVQRAEAHDEKEPSERELIERVQPSEMLPDRFQPRPVLPLELHQQFFKGELDCYQVAVEWLRMSDEDEGHRKRVSELIDMAESVDDHGQIKPITGSWETTEEGSYLFRIETGERRFWGVCLKKVLDKQEDEPLLRVEAVKTPTLERQIVENRHAQPPSTVAQAREISALILKKLGHKPDPALEDPYEYFRTVNNLPGRQRLPKGIWKEIEPVMQLTPSRMRQVLSVLDMPTDLLERSDRYNLSYRVMQAILLEPEDRWVLLLDLAVEQSLTGEELTALAGIESQEAIQKRRLAKKRDYAWSALRGLRGFSGAVTRAGERRRNQVLDVMADELVIQENVSDVLSMLEDLVSLIRIRIQGLEEVEEVEK
jgi:hypothetical protein